MSHPVHRHLGAGFIATLLLAAGGGVSAATTTPDTGADTTPACDVDPSVTVRWSLPATDFAMLPPLLAEALGYFDDEGLSVERLADTGNAVASTQSVISGQVDIAGAGTSAVMSAIGQDRPIRSIGVLTQGSTLELILSPGAAASLEEQEITPSSPIADRIQALDGLSFASYPDGSTTRLNWASALEMYGMSESDLTVRPLPDGASISAALREGQVDGMFLGLPGSAISVAEGWGVHWINMYQDVPEIGQVNYIELVAQQSFLDEHPCEVQAFRRAIQRADDLLTNDTETAIEAVKPLFAETDPDVVATVVAAVVPLYDTLEPREESWDRALQQYNESADSPVEITFADFYDSNFRAGS